MRFLKRFDYDYNFLGKRRIAMTISAVLMAVCILSFLVRGLELGLDFTGGTLVEVEYSEAVELEGIRTALQENGFPKAVVQHFGTAKTVLIRLALIEGGTADKAEKEAISSKILAVLKTKGDKFELRRVDFVGPQIGGELVEAGGLAIIYTLIGILIYVALRFEYRFAFGAIAALVHDTVITVGIFSLLGLEFDLTVLAAVLAVIGYSLNDTIVAFDRIRDNFLKMRKRTSEEVINISINQILTRTIMTSVTTSLVLLVLFFVGGELIHGFATALLIGVIVGTYSSIYIASATTLALGISKADLMPVEKEGAEFDSQEL